MNAFPTPSSKDSWYRIVNGVPEYDGSPGMSLRDYFAAKYMQGYMANSNPNCDHGTREEASRQAYLMADAMLKARES